MLVHLGFKSGKERLFRICQDLHNLTYFSVSSTNTESDSSMHILAPTFPAFKGGMHSCPVTHLTLPPWCFPHPTDRLFLTKNKDIKRSVRNPKSLCVFPECLWRKLSTVKVISDLVFRKAIDKSLPTRMGPGNICFDEPGWMFQSRLESYSWKQREDWTFCSNRNSRGFLPAIQGHISGCSQKIRDWGPSTGKLSDHTRENGRGKPLLLLLEAERK